MIKDNTTLWIDLNTTTRCNLCCKHCFNSRYNDNGVASLDMPLDMIKDIIDQFVALKHPLKGRSIILTGGEPTMYKYLRDVIDYVHSIKQNVYMTSNGYKIPEIVSYMRNEDSVTISLDGNKEWHDWMRGDGSYDNVISALSALKHHNIGRSILFTLHQGNYESFKDVVEICDKYDCKSIAVNRWQPLNDKNYGLKQVSREVSNFAKHWASSVCKTNIIRNMCSDVGCIGGITGLSVRPDGTYWNCTRSRRILGMYPQRINDIMLWDKIKAGITIPVIETCEANHGIYSR